VKNVSNPDELKMSYALAAAAEIELPIAEEYLSAVEQDFDRIRVIARFLMEFPLDQTIEVGPVFQP
jgi:hypothetical protein